MKNINFNVSEDTIEKLSEDVIISDSYNYVCLIFNFDSSWSQYNVKKATYFSDNENGYEKYFPDNLENLCIQKYRSWKFTMYIQFFNIPTNQSNNPPTPSSPLSINTEDLNKP